ncbi:16S rRNA (cytidine(1402)-2'-O)-methyltransferase [Campylobacter blaseri]|nr:16S rRNA (cytidine(1402)-2'-O)-methyltransferase [Campylobacter blaseri]
MNVISSSEIVFCEDTRVAKKLINLLKDRYNLNIKEKIFYSVHSHNEKDFIFNIDQSIFEKECIYMSDAGMPCISDPGVHLVRYMQEKKLAYEVLSGSNALLLSAVASGIVEKEFTFLGFLSNRGEARKIEIQNVLNSIYPVVLYESPKRIIGLIDDICEVDKDRRVFLIKEATKKFETKYIDSAKNLKIALEDKNLNGEWSVVIEASKNQNSEKITLQDIESLDIPPKQKAKLISKITGKSVKEIYNNLIK